MFFFYLTTLEKINQSKIGINVTQDDKSDIDVVPYLKAIDGIRTVFEDKIPTEAYARLRNEVERITVFQSRTKMIDLDKLMEVVIQNFLWFDF